MKLTRAQEKEIRALRRKVVRDSTGRCLVEGQKVIDAAGDAIDMVFRAEDTDRFEWLVTTKTPQGVAGVARIPTWSIDDLREWDVIVVLDGVQDPGNVGSMLRLCQGFGASLLLVESADPASPKVVRSSVGAMFHVPWMSVSREEADDLLASLERPVYRLEARDGAQTIDAMPDEPMILIVGSEGSGVQMQTAGTSIAISHKPELESLNVGHALAIALHNRFTRKG